MKRFHVHVAVLDLDQSIDFYSRMFAAEPTVKHADYAKWMLDDPRINFAISSRGASAGVNHLGFQVDSDAELSALRAHAQAADLNAIDETGAACCYANSDKHWIADPNGIPWETFHTLGEIPVFGQGEADAAPSAASGVCCPTAPPKTSSCCG